MNFSRLRSSNLLQTMAEDMRSSAAAATTSKKASRSLWPSVLRWIPTSTNHIIAAEERLLSLVKTPYTQEQVNIGSGPPGSKIRWFRSTSDEPRFINTVTFDSKEGSPTLVMVHGYAASQGFFFRNFDALAKHFRVIAVDQLGWGGSSRPDFTCKSTEEISNGVSVHPIILGHAHLLKYIISLHFYKAACNILVEKCCKTRETWAMTHILQYMKENRLVLCYPVTWKLTLKVASESDVRLRQVNPDFSFEHANKDEIDDCNAINTDIESVIDGRLILDFLRSKNFVAVDYLLSCMMDKNTRLDSGIISTAMKVNSAQCY